MKCLALLTLSLCTLAATTSCKQDLPPVPMSNNRTIVPPKGSTEVTKSWNTITRNEGDAVLGPLSNARR